MLTRRRFLPRFLSAIALPLPGTRARRDSSLQPSIDPFDVRPRDRWANDRPPLDSPIVEDVRFLLVHHSASPNAYRENDVESILQGFFDYHTSSDKGWSDIAYNFLIDRFGDVWEGRAGSLDGPVAGDAAGGNQGFSQLVCLIGDFTSEMPSPEATASLVSVLAWLADKYGVSTRSGSEISFISRGSNRWPAGEKVVTSPVAGHRDMSISSCPGDVLYENVKEGLLADVEARRLQLAAVSTTHKTTSTTEAASSPPIMQEPVSQTTTALASPVDRPIEGQNAVASETPLGDLWLKGLAAGAFATVLALIIGRRSDGARSHDRPDQ